MKKKRAPKRAGRPSIYDEGITPDDVLKVYEKGLSCRKSAALLGVSVRTYRKYTNALGRSTSSAGRVGPGITLEFTNGYRVPKLLLWVRDHPHRKLPRSLPKIAAATGIPVGTVKSYLRHRQLRLATWVRGLGDLRELQGTVILDETSRHIPVELINTYQLKVDQYDLSVKIHLVIKGGVFLRASLPWPRYAELFGKTPKDAPWVPKRRVPLAPKSPS